MFKQFSYSKTLFLIREAFTSLLPIVLIMSILVLLSGLMPLLHAWNFSDVSILNGEEVNRLYFFLIPLFLNLSLSTILAREKELDSIGVILISMVCFFRLTGFLEIDDSGSLITSPHATILTSIPCALVSVNLLSYFSKFSRINLIKRSLGISPKLRKNLSLFIPGLITLLCFEFFGKAFNFLQRGAIDFFSIQHLTHITQSNAVEELALYKGLSLFMWFVGIHGEHSAEGVFRLIKDIPVGASSGIALKSFHDVFLNIGGAGSTFTIPLLLLLTNDIFQYRYLARIALPFSFFNVNEILLFGLPIIWNPTFLIPFIVAPFVNMAIGLTAVYLGLFNISETVPWMAPPLYSAYVASDGSLWAVLTHALCIVVDGFIYYPFVLLATQQLKTPVKLQRLLGEDAYGFVHEEINLLEEKSFEIQQMNTLANIHSAHSTLNKLRGGQFILYFQPKIDADLGTLVGIETLLRYQSASGEILPPFFLPVLYQQGLSKAIDKKVITLVFQQVQQWQSEGLSLPQISINVDKDFLLDTKAVEAFLNRARKHQICFCLEITEHTYTTELDSLASVIRRVRKAGHQIAIDDFGAGYSSLTTLLLLEADEIKLDRNLVVPPAGEEHRGHTLLRLSIQLCHELGFKVVAEGVETPEQLQLVCDFEVDIVQGYFTGKPMNPSSIKQLF